MKRTQKIELYTARASFSSIRRCIDVRAHQKISLLLPFSPYYRAACFQNPLPPLPPSLSEMGKIKEQKTLEEEPHLPSPLLSKRKPDVDSATEDSVPSKKLKKSDLEIPIAAPQENHNSTAEEAVEDKGSNGNPRIDKGKAVMRDDKGKGKAKVEEEEEEDDNSSGSGGSSDEDGDDGVEKNGGDDDSDVSDDPLAEVDLDNILPSRTRRRAAEPGAYLVNDMDDDDDDDDDDVEEDAEDDDSE